jgi:hypothetical protein
MATKNSKIVHSQFSTEWKSPNGSSIYYHTLVMDNGDKGSCGTKEKSPPKLWAGANVSYTIDNGKIKILTSDMDDSNSNTDFIGENASKSKSKTPKHSQQESFLGYAWSYAKDMVIAGKTMDDVEELQKIAKFIYDEIGTMLKNE